MILALHIATCVAISANFLTITILCYCNKLPLLIGTHCLVPLSFLITICILYQRHDNLELQLGAAQKTVTLAFVHIPLVGCSPFY